MQCFLYFFLCFIIIFFSIHQSSSFLISQPLRVAPKAIQTSFSLFKIFHIFISYGLCAQHQKRRNLPFLILPFFQKLSYILYLTAPMRGEHQSGLSPTRFGLMGASSSSGPLMHLNGKPSYATHISAGPRLRLQTSSQVRSGNTLLFCNTCVFLKFF